MRTRRGDRASSEGGLGMVSDYPAVGIARSICIPRGRRPGRRCALFQIGSLVLLFGVAQSRFYLRHRCGRYVQSERCSSGLSPCRCWIDGGVDRHRNLLAVVGGAYAPGSVVSGKGVSSVCTKSLAGQSMNEEVTTMKIDKELQQQVMDELAWEPSIDAAEIGASVDSGVVMLSGTVRSFPEKLVS